MRYKDRIKAVTVEEHGLWWVVWARQPGGGERKAWTGARSASPGQHQGSWVKAQDPGRQRTQRPEQNKARGSGQRVVCLGGQQPASTGHRSKVLPLGPSVSGWGRWGRGAGRGPGGPGLWPRGQDALPGHTGQAAALSVARTSDRSYENPAGVALPRPCAHVHAHSPEHLQCGAGLPQSLAQLLDATVLQRVAAHLQLQEALVLGQHCAEVAAAGSREAAGLHPAGDKHRGCGFGATPRAPLDSSTIPQNQPPPSVFQAA